VPAPGAFTPQPQARPGQHAADGGAAPVPAPLAPTESPLGLGSAGSWAPGSGGLFVFAAALVAAFLLVAPLLGRWLRPLAAWWPPAPPALALERPG
jgi:hypothetical protein